MPLTGSITHCDPSAPAERATFEAGGTADVLDGLGDRADEIKALTVAEVQRPSQKKGLRPHK
ncbi:hypothetical protein EVJ58_g7307 [Rhodofomes roseus]|uniref:Uncharacterized protein n=1 Tax=Rhodofomes roseus TaxID=34475 RepID=A0A4Y9Y6B6_9APHY|nr:hypothetical protein EVJ58_g7307 [Rhodofomes roseus]